MKNRDTIGRVGEVEIAKNMKRQIASHPVTAVPHALERPHEP